MVAHDFTYPLGHIVTGSFWHNLKESSLHLTIADTGWGKAVWGLSLIHICLTFEKGELKAVNDETFDDPIKAIQKVEEIGAAYGIGRDTQVFESVFFLTHFLPPHLPRDAYRHYTKYLRICPFLRINFTDIS